MIMNNAVNATAQHPHVNPQHFRLDELGHDADDAEHVG